MLCAGRGLSPRARMHNMTRIRTKPSGGVDDCGLRQPDDVAAVAAWLRTQPGVLADRIGIVGFSQGGQVALLTATRDPRLAAVVAYFPVTDVARWRQTTNNPAIPTYVTQLGRARWRRSALAGAACARDRRASASLIHGDADLRVPTQQSYLMHDTLIRRRAVERDRDDPRRAARLHRCGRGGVATDRRGSFSPPPDRAVAAPLVR